MPRKSSFTISNPERVLYPAGNFTKADVVEYYLRVARYILPHLKHRPVTLKRYPEGVLGEFFYEKDAPTFTPEWVKTFPVPRRDGGPDIRYILINDARTLAWAANIAALELHPFLHRAPRIDVPTAVVFDLDPGEGADLRDSSNVALLIRDLLARLDLESFVKLSGSKGLQVYVPLNTPVTYEAAQPFARAVAEMLEREHPKLVVSDMAKNVRKGRVFIDWSQNADYKTTVGVYSLRAKQARPFVSMPVEWDELTSGKTLRFSPADAIERLGTIGDLFAPLLKLKQKLPPQFVQNIRAARPPRALDDYDRKRDFTRTSEPRPVLPRRSSQGGRRRFVIQKHAASHLHYDFRLEMSNVLKSWAVPRGLPVEAGTVRSAFETEDHPLDYLEFEGIIPEGQYGGGTVMVWDIGTYDLVDGNYWKGALTVHLAGKKLKGEWTLRRTDSADGKRTWMLVKSGRSARAISHKNENASALTGRTMEAIAAEKDRVWQSDREPAPKPRKERSRRKAQLKADSIPAPAFVSPMKATVVEKLPPGDAWIYEVKWDGYRAIALKHGDSVRLLSLKEKSLSNDFPDVVAAVKTIDVHTAVIDGEVVAVDASGRPSFQALQNRRSHRGKWRIVYYAFDLLNVDGKDLRRLPLCDRRSRLSELIAGSSVRFSAELEGDAESVLASVRAANLEGVMAKRRDSPYQPGTRSKAWLKLKIGNTEEFVIGGYNPDAGSFQSLLVGHYENKKLIFAGKVRQGFNPASRRRLYEQLQPLVCDRCPFANLPSSKKSHFGEGVTAQEMKKLRWLKPRLVAQVQFTEWTQYGLLRHATFLGIRDDKNARDAVAAGPRK